MTQPPPPSDPDAGVPALARELAGRLGVARYVETCTSLLGGADRASYRTELSYLTGFTFEEGDPTMDPGTWKDYWVRTWGARGLLHVWDDSASDAVVAGLGDAHWRPAEMCLKVAARHEVAGAGDGAQRLVGHALPRVRAQALRALGAVGDTEHVGAVRGGQDDPEPSVRRAATRALDLLVARLDLPVER